MVQVLERCERRARRAAGGVVILWLLLQADCRRRTTSNAVSTVDASAGFRYALRHLAPRLHHALWRQ
jgi:hypothetical protein